jgi:hypothetical protein
MERSHELNTLYIKAIKVINSCLTLIQLDTAKKYVEQYEKVYIQHFYDIEDYNPIRLIGMIELKKFQIINVKSKTKVKNKRII